MKLPEIDEHMEICIRDEATPLEIVQLHCLRSIAVSLECMARMLGVETGDLGDKAYKDLLAILEYHSVSKIVPNAKGKNDKQ